MRRRAAVVVPLSPSDCWNCHSRTTLIACEKCGVLQEAPDSINSFALFSLPEGLAINSEKLRDTFYSLSKTVHPDKYFGKSPRESLLATRWSALINKNYLRLKDDEDRSLYLLELKKVGLSKNPPTELAEMYFEIQDSSDEEELRKFEKVLSDMTDSNRKEWEGLAKGWSDSKVDSLRKNIETKRYLQSMLADLRKKLGEDDGNSRH